MKVISYSLYGKDTKYTIGMIRNVETAKLLYPDWKCYIYHNDTVPQDIIKELNSYNNVKLIDMTHMKTPGMFWRFLANNDSDVEYFMVRDSDSRISKRESLAVEEWINSGKRLHVMRDHPHHNYVILGGMWGMKCDKTFNMEQEIKLYNKSSDLYEKMSDMNFLRDIVYLKYKNDSIVHASYHKFEPWSKNFTVDWDDYKFVGEIYNADETREYQYKLLK
jgi:hypothetical protein